MKIFLKITLFFIILTILTIFLLFVFIWKDTEYIPSAIDQNNTETVVVLHGITKTNRTTHLLAQRIADAGFNVYNITYPSTEYSIEELSDILNEKIIELGLNKKKKLHFVGHSMGGLLIREYIYKHKPANLGRVVMVGTPNNGSELSNKFQNWWLYQQKFGTKAGFQLGTDLKGLERLPKKINYDLGIIAGKTWVNPIFSKMLPNDDDGMVSSESTKLEGMRDYILMDFPHTLGIQYKSVAQQVANYLKHGKFEKV